MAVGQQSDSVQCVECEKFIDPSKGFVCRSCRRRPLCPEHRDRKIRGVCEKCANSERRKKHSDLVAGARSLKSFLRFIQFIFLVSAIMFTAQRLIPDLIPSYIADNLIFRFVYIPGILSAVAFVVVYMFYLGQKSAIREVQDELGVPQSFSSRGR